MLNDLPPELLDNIIYNINTTEDILNIRLINRNFYNLLREIPIYKYDKLIYNIIFNANNIKKYHNNELMKEIVFKSYGGVKIYDYHNYTNVYFFSTPKKRTYQKKYLVNPKLINSNYIGCNLN